MMHQYNGSWALKFLDVYVNFEPIMTFKGKKLSVRKSKYWTTTYSFVTEDDSYLSGRMSVLTRRTHFHDYSCFWQQVNSTSAENALQMSSKLRTAEQAAEM